MRNSLLVATVLGLSGAPLLAQDKGTWEIGGFGKYTDYHNSYETTRRSANSYGGGGRIGYFLNPHWELEVSGSGNATDVKEFFKGFSSTGLTYYPFRLRALFNQQLGSDGPVSWLIGAGPAYNRYGKSVTGIPGFKGNDWGVGLATGFRAKLTNWLAARLDGTLDYIPTPNNGKTAIISQGAGITASSAASQNTNLGAELGLSVMPNLCRKGKDGTTIAPSTASTGPGGSASFSATATHCGRPDLVAFTLSGPGTVDQAGRYAAAGPGTATITACGKKNKMCATSTVTVQAPPPPPPPRTLTRCEISPSSASPRIDQPVSYSVTGYWSDGTSAPLPNATLSASGGSVSGNAVSWSTPGAKTVTANCGNGLSATASADVQQLAIVVRDSAYFKVNKTIIYRTDDQGRLKAIAQVLKDHPDIKLVIDGHTDADASVQYNAKLGMNRATAMKTYLAKQGVAVDRMTIILRSFGECQPVAENKTAGGRASNRRAELHEFGNTAPGEASADCREAGRERKP